jgi:phosphohistidine phosphatase SixA
MKRSFCDDEAMHRRHFLHTTPAWLAAVVPVTALGRAQAQAEPETAQRIEQALRAGGVVLAARHALAPGNFDPPGFKLGDCSTQRNLSDEGRAQARRLGDWVRARGLSPAQVRSSPWCRCEETARLAFGTVHTWTALGSPRGFSDSQNQAHQRELRQALRALSERQAPFEVWVTHNFVFSALVGSSAASAECLVLRPGAGDSIEVVARLAVA